VEIGVPDDVAPEALGVCAICLSVGINCKSSDFSLAHGACQTAPRCWYVVGELELRNSDELNFRAASDQALLVDLGTNARVVRLLRAMEADRLRGVVNLHPAYFSLLIRFDSLVTSHAELEGWVREMMSGPTGGRDSEPRVVEIPVRYDGPDLEDVAKLCGMTAGEVIERHTSTLYTVYFLGFVPGFAYMGTLPPEIVVPRLEKPRTSVPAGSVAIANDQTAVYPISTPGGWRLIGTTDLKLFDPSRESLSVLNTGDQVRFRPVGS
jgi:KipI family sensor histidine kinase inhibitor